LYERVGVRSRRSVLVPELILLALLIGWISGGKFWRITDARIKHVWLIFVPLALYVASWALTHAVAPEKLKWLFAVMAVIEKLVLIVVAVANVRLPGMKLILAGLVLNVVAIVANSGFMPANPHAIQTAFGAEYLKRAMTDIHVRSAIMNASTELGFLCDIVAARRPFVLVPAVYSVGDLVMSAGIFVAIIGLMRTPLPGEKKDRKVGDNAG
jgi:hypothetical protein